MTTKHPGLDAALNYPLFSAIFNRRSRRISRGLKSIPAGSLSYTSEKEPKPLSPLEEALLIAATGTTGVTMPDLPLQDHEGHELVGSPLLKIYGRAASSPNNAQSTHFFLINDSGTYFIKRPDPDDIDPDYFTNGDLTPEKLIDYTEKCKVKVLDHRLDYPREYPFYFGTNGFVSNVPGSTILVPVIDMTRQYIHGIMYLLDQPDGFRPRFIDDWFFYRNAGVDKWVKNGFLNKDILPIPLGLEKTFRIHIEADLLMQNIMLAIQAMGLGGWIHAAFFSPFLLGDPQYKEHGTGLNFRYEKPICTLRNLLFFTTPLPAWQANPVGLDGLLEGLCPPYYDTMSDAVDALQAEKYGKDGIYTNPKYLDKILKPGLAEKHIGEITHYSEEVVECTKDICTYIYETYGRFPAHVDAMLVPGVWVQAHNLDLEYYDRFYRGGYSESQANHDYLWYGH